jgi:16S rRNA (cytosine967-C5)-methyltransferase
VTGSRAHPGSRGRRRRPDRRRGAPEPRRGPSARRVALDALDRIEGEGAYANLALSGLLDRSGLAAADRRFVTDLVYGTTRLRRACDHLVDGFLDRPVQPRVRNALRLGAYQLAFAGVPPHAAVAETVEVAPRPARGLVNAVLRRVAEAGVPAAWPDEATRLSVPDWVLAELASALGHADAVAAVEAMNEPATVTVRDDGYVQDPASQQVATAVGVQPGERVLDACAAPGGKATALAAAPGALVVAADVRPGRAGLVARNIARLRSSSGGAPAGRDPSSAAPSEAPPPAEDRAGRIVVVAADAGLPPWRAGVFDRVVVDAPCTGLGTLRRRADLRWRVEPDAVARLSALQRRLLAASADLVRPGGTLVYSVCTLTAAETVDVDAWLADARPDLVPVAPPLAPWRPWGRGALLLPQAAGTDGMGLFAYTRTPAAGAA